MRCLSLVALAFLLSVSARAQDAGARDAGPRARDAGVGDAATRSRDAGTPPAEAPDAAVDATQPRYLSTISRELDAMSIVHTCEAVSQTRGVCSYRVPGPTSHRELEIHLVYSDDSDTIYVYVDHYLVIAPDAEGSAAILRRLMELNWQLLAAKLEWHGTDGEVRLSSVIHTDSNFDRRAFRSCLRSLQQVADRHYLELSRTLEPAP